MILIWEETSMEGSIRCYGYAGGRKDLGATIRGVGDRVEEAEIACLEESNDLVAEVSFQVYRSQLFEMSILWGDILRKKIINLETAILVIYGTKE